MTRVLHLLKGDDTELLLTVLAQQQAAGDELTLIRLPGARVATWISSCAPTHATTRPTCCWMACTAC